MNPFVRAVFIAGIITISAVAQQDTNTPPEELQPQEAQTAEHPEDDRIQFLATVASAYLSENDPASAITAFERILEIDPTNRDARYAVSTVYLSTQQYAKAEQLLKTLIEEQPQDVAARNNLAWLYATAENPAFRDAQKAIDLAHEAMVLAPRSHNVWSTLAEAYYADGQYEKATRAINHMTVLAGASPNITEEMAATYNRQIRKHRRALITDKTLQADEDEASPAIQSVDEDAQEQQD